MRYDPYKVIILLIGIPFTLWFFLPEQYTADADLKFGAAFVWFGVGASLLLLSHSRS